MIEVIPAMDLIGGRCVRLMNGDFSRETVYTDDPLETAKLFESCGLKRLHMVDLDGARTGSPANLHVLERVASGTGLTIDYGGGVKTESGVSAVLNAGASIVNIGSLAAREPDTLVRWIERFGADAVLLGADIRNGNVAIDGWATATDLPIIDYLKNFVARGVRRAFVTDVAFDGAMAGPSLRLYRRILEAVGDLQLIASGGVRSTEDIEDLDAAGCTGVIVGRALYEKKITLEELSKYAR